MTDAAVSAEVVAHPVLMQRRALVLLDKVNEGDRHILAQLENLEQLLLKLAEFFPTDAVRAVRDWVATIRATIGRTRPATVEGVACRTEAWLGLVALQKALAGTPKTAPVQPKTPAEVITFPR